MAVAAVNAKVSVFLATDVVDELQTLLGVSELAFDVDFEELPLSQTLGPARVSRRWRRLFHVQKGAGSLLASQRRNLRLNALPVRRLSSHC